MWIPVGLRLERVAPPAVVIILILETENGTEIITEKEKGKEIGMMPGTKEAEALRQNIMKDLLLVLMMNLLMNLIVVDLVQPENTIEILEMSLEEALILT